jgi:hypothetical protein
MGAARRRFTPVMATTGEMWKDFVSPTQQLKILDEFVHMPRSASIRNCG